MSTVQIILGPGGQYQVVRGNIILSTLGNLNQAIEVKAICANLDCKTKADLLARV